MSGVRILLPVVLVAAALSLRWLPRGWFDGSGSFWLTALGIVLVLVAIASLPAAVEAVRIWLAGKMR